MARSVMLNKGHNSVWQPCMSQRWICSYLWSIKCLFLCSYQAFEWQWYFCFGSYWTLQEIAQPQENVSLSHLLKYMLPWIVRKEEGIIFFYSLVLQWKKSLF